MVAEITNESAEFILWQMPLAQARQYQMAWLAKRGIQCVTPAESESEMLEQIDRILNV